MKEVAGAGVVHVLMAAHKELTGPGQMIEIHNVSAFLHNTRVFEVLNLQIKAGEKVAILGPNGSGKSTLLKLISREICPVARPQSWIKLFGSEIVNLWDLRRKIGIISQELQEDYTPYTAAFEVILSGFFGAIGQYDHLHADKAQLQRAKVLLHRIGMDEYHDTMYQRLSTGQKRRLLVARALVHSPTALIFDEPFNGLDIRALADLFKLMRDFCVPGNSLILTTHHVDEIIPEINRVVLLQAGRVVADGDKQAVLTSEQLSRLYGLPLRLTEQHGWYRLWLD
jgi:iron complex transport system ATP-binding protein